MIRKIEVKDAETIQKICKKSLGYDVKVDLVEKQIKKLLFDDSHHIIFVYEDEVTNEVLGFVHGEIYESIYSEIGINILGLAVNESHQGNGIGKILMDSIEDYAKLKNISYIRLNSAEHRVLAHKFYEKIGYNGDKIQKRFIKTF